MEIRQLLPEDAEGSQGRAEAPDRWTYSDLAIEAPKSDEFEQLSLYHATSGGEAALARKTLGDTIRDFSGRPRRCDFRDSGGIISGHGRSGTGQSCARPYWLVASEAGRDFRRAASKINAFETGSPGPFAEEALDKIRAALEAAGVVFIPKDGGAGIGVRLREPHEGEYIGWNDLNASNDE